MDIGGKKNWMVEKLRSTGHAVERKGFGIIRFAKKHLKGAFKYFQNGGVEEATFEALPYVLENANEAEPTHPGESPETGSLATAKDSASQDAAVVKDNPGHRQGDPLVTAPEDSIIDGTGDVNTETVGAAQEGSADAVSRKEPVLARTKASKIFTNTFANATL